MSKTVPIIGIAVDEICWLRMLVALLRHPDPSVPELARHALIYLTDASRRDSRVKRPETLDHAG